MSSFRRRGKLDSARTIETLALPRLSGPPGATVPAPLALEIVPYQACYAQAFRELNLAWLLAFFSVEERDLRELENPESEFISNGGQVLVALDEGTPIGVCALRRKSVERFELAKMAVAENRRGCGVGRALLEAAIARARLAGASTIVLLTHPLLSAAVTLYERTGFVQVPRPEAEYIRAESGIMMQLQLDP